MTARIVIYAGVAGFVIGYFAHAYTVRLLQHLAPAEMCAWGANHHRVALFGVAPLNALFYAIGAFVVTKFLKILPELSDLRDG